MTPLLFYLFLFLWIAFVGGTVGSFLNVVVYRVPAGMSVVHPPSRCPKCEHAIRWYDNIPVLGWLWLRGRCRDCGVKISPRYPIVEAITALMFVAVAWADGIDRVWFETFVAVRSDVGVDVFIYTCCGYLLHVVMLSAIWTAALMQYDRHMPPLTFTIAAAVGIGLATSVIHELWQIRTPLFWQGTPFRPVEILIMAILLTGFAMLSTYFWTVRPSEYEQSRWSFAEWSFVAALVVTANEMMLAVVAAVLLAFVSSLACRRTEFPLLFLFAGLTFAIVLLEPLTGAARFLAFQSQATVTAWHLIWHNWFPLTLCLLIVAMTEACVVIRRRSPAVVPNLEGVEIQVAANEPTASEQSTSTTPSHELDIDNK